MRHRIEYAAVRTLVAIVALIPTRLVRPLGACLGLAVYLVDAGHRRVATENVARAFPSRSRPAQRAIVRGAFAHVGRLLLEMLKFSRLSRARMLSRLEFEGEDHARQAFARGKGVLFVTGHFGYWEILALAQSLRNGPVGVVARPLDNPALNDLLERMRTVTGNTVIYRKGAIRRMLRTLHSGAGLGVLMDQHVQSDAVVVNFFDRPAATTALIGALAVRSSAPVIPLFALPVSGGGFRVVYEHPVDPPRDESEDAIREFTQRWTDVLEMYVRRYPELWLWMHRRWRAD